jgi:phage/conjugal plasmid C-4 type zinc finger TraR family protein
MADIIDEASERTEIYLAQAIYRARNKIGECSGREAACDCEDCGEAIPEKRRRAVPGCRRCVECQMDLEEGG